MLFGESEGSNPFVEEECGGVTFASYEGVDVDGECVSCGCVCGLLFVDVLTVEHFVFGESGDCGGDASVGVWECFA